MQVGGRHVAVCCERESQSVQIGSPRGKHLMHDPLSVLLVDDNPTFLRIATRFLTEYSDGALNVVGVAHGGEEALTLARELEPEIVLIDLAMPDLPGLEVIPQLRNLVPHTKIIVLTLLDTEGYRRAATDAGANAFVPKASLSTDLLPTIQQIQSLNGELQPGSI